MPPRTRSSNINKPIINNSNIENLDLDSSETREFILLSHDQIYLCEFPFSSCIDKFPDDPLSENNDLVLRYGLLLNKFKKFILRTPFLPNSSIENFKITLESYFNLIKSIELGEFDSNTLRNLIEELITTFFTLFNKFK